MTPQEERLTVRLEEMGIQITRLPVENSPFFFDWELRYASICVRRRNVDSALLDFLAELLKLVNTAA